MKQQIKSRLVSIGVIAGVVGIALAPLAASAVTENTTINANIGSTISLSSNVAQVDINITPVSGGAQTSASENVTVSTNDSGGYNLTLADDDTTLTLDKGPDTLAATADSFGTPGALDNNSWGWASPGIGSFDASYSPALNNATSSASLWAAIPSSASPQLVKTTAAPTAGDVTTFWYSAKADTSKPDGTYTDDVVYTALVN